MLYETGRVVAIDSDGLWLETLKKTTCGQCSAKAGCGQQLLAKSALTNMTFIKALFPSPSSTDSMVTSWRKDRKDRNEGVDEPSPLIRSDIIFDNWQIGDTVEIALDESSLVKATAIAYLLPLIAMVISTVIAAQVFVSDYLIALAGVSGLIAGGILVRLHSGRGSVMAFFQAMLGDGSSKQKVSEEGSRESCYHALVVRKI